MNLQFLEIDNLRMFELKYITTIKRILKIQLGQYLCNISLKSSGVQTKIRRIVGYMPDFGRLLYSLNFSTQKVSSIVNKEGMTTPNLNAGFRPTSKDPSDFRCRECLDSSADFRLS